MRISTLVLLGVFAFCPRRWTHVFYIEIWHEQRRPDVARVHSDEYVDGSYSQTGFVEDWSVFYWGWWIAYGPFMGLFVTRISKGRTLKQLIVGMVGFGRWVLPFFTWSLAIRLCGWTSRD
ncbi:MAG: hypothetical protein Ct9H300mP8_07240 [Gammaproteobacteria bacterium]|nr:MAG: hypothetical protein Ct9H300mP8_07240 [Gammaproteobacteria bacterium]